jgi:HYR domain
MVRDPEPIRDMHKLVLVIAALAASLVVGAATTAAVPLAAGGDKAVTGTLDLRAKVSMKSPTQDPCPPGTPPSAWCYARTGEGGVRGLGRVTQSYIYVANHLHPSCPSETVKILGHLARFAVAGKGEIHFAVADFPDCLTPRGAYTPTQSFTITGGTGSYAGASGGGRVERMATGCGPGCAAGSDTWIGTLVVPGLEFDVTAPTISGAKSKTVRAPEKANRARVTFRVTARDDVDGLVRVPCRPASGSRFNVGRTTVRCSATDTSANTARAAFRVTVRRRR